MQNPYNLRKAPYIAQSRTQMCAKYVQTTQIRIHCAKLYTNVRKSCTTYTKPHRIAQTVCYRRLPTTQQVDLKRHGTQKKIQVPTSWSWLEKIMKGKCNNKSRIIIGKGTALVPRGQWHAQTLSALISIQWGFNSRQVKNPHFGSCENLIEFLRARLAIAHGLTGNNITTGPNQYRFTWTFIDGEALHIFDLKSTELRHESVANLVLVMYHVVTYFDPK